METKLTLNNVRLSFPDLWEKSKFQGQEGKFKATFLFPKKGPRFEKLAKQIRALENALIAEHKLTKIGKGLDKRALRDGDEKEYEEYEGCWSLRASNDFKPGLYDRQALQVDREESPFYAGCFVNAEVSLWAQNNQYGQRINATLLNVQFVRDGEAFISGKPGKPDFGPVDDAEEEEPWEDDIEMADDAGADTADVGM